MGIAVAGLGGAFVVGWVGLQCCIFFTNCYFLVIIIVVLL